jgi:hypothetical protein
VGQVLPKVIPLQVQLKVILRQVHQKVIPRQVQLIKAIPLPRQNQ